MSHRGQPVPESRHVQWQLSKPPVLIGSYDGLHHDHALTENQQGTLSQSVTRVTKPKRYARSDAP